MKKNMRNLEQTRPYADVSLSDLRIQDWLDAIPEWRELLVMGPIGLQVPVGAIRMLGEGLRLLERDGLAAPREFQQCVGEALQKLLNETAQISSKTPLNVLVALLLMMTASRALVFQFEQTLWDVWSPGTSRGRQIADNWILLYDRASRPDATAADRLVADSMTLLVREFAPASFKEVDGRPEVVDWASTLEKTAARPQVLQHTLRPLPLTWPQHLRLIVGGRAASWTVLGVTTTAILSVSLLVLLISGLLLRQADLFQTAFINQAILPYLQKFGL